MENAKLTPGNIAILAGGAVVLIGSFLDFYKGKSFSVGGVTFGGGSVNAWGEGQLGIVTIPIVLAVASAVIVALTAFASVNLPDRVLGLTWDQIHLAYGFQATIMMLAFLIRSAGPSVDRGIGLFLMLLGAIAVFVGAILRMREAAQPAPPPPAF